MWSCALRDIWGVADDAPPSLLDKVVEALVSASTTKEIIAAAVGAAGGFGDSPPRPNGRPRKHADKASRHRAYRARKRVRHETPRDETPRHETRHETSRIGEMSAAGSKLP